MLSGQFGSTTMFLSINPLAKRVTMNLDNSHRPVPSRRVWQLLTPYCLSERRPHTTSYINTYSIDKARVSPELIDTSKGALLRDI